MLFIMKFAAWGGDKKIELDQQWPYRTNQYMTY